MGLAWAGGCGSDDPPPEDDEGQGCPEDLLNEVQIIQNAVAAFDAYVDRHVRAATPACVAIIEDLGGTPPPVSLSDPTADDLTQACGAARQIVVTEVMNQAAFSIEITDAPCATNESLDACTIACGFGQACDTLCPALAVLETECPSPTVTVSAAQTFKDTLETNLPKIAPLANENPNIQSAVGSLNMSFSVVLSGLDEEPMCTAQREEVAGAQMNVGPTQTEHSSAASTVANFLAALEQ